MAALCFSWAHDFLPESFGGKALPFRTGMDVNLHRKTDLTMAHAICHDAGICAALDQ
ncbi:MAG: hypothetical protein ACYCOU_26725 [Sulfobacillus sp.]